MTRYLRFGLAAFLAGMILTPLPASPIVTTNGKDLAIRRVLDATTPGAVFNYLTVGDGNGSGTCTGAAAGDTALQHELSTRVQQTNPTAPVGGSGAQSIVVTFAAGNGTGSLCEIGLFNASSGVTMLVRRTFSVVSKAAGDSLQATLTLTLS